ncbi:MAG: hypothetical protein JJ979_14890 [Roseibium sp.]|nr:hypothetical protein [Roseibium sp.]
MIFGLSGAHRSGKSTLAKDVAEAYGIEFMDLQTRLEAQEKLLETHISMLQIPSAPTIIDRTPLDMAGYMLAELGMHSDPDIGARVATYAQKCINATLNYYSAVVVVRPLPFYEVDPTKPPENIGFQNHHQYLVEGLLPQIRGIVSTATIVTDDRQERAYQTGQFLAEVQDVEMDVVAGATIN